MPRRDAVIVGINDYGGNGGVPDLNSCIADANAMEDILRTQYGFFRITKLLDAQATVENLDAALDDLFRNAAPDDRLVFYYSGHGYRPIVDGRLIEVLVLHGARFYEDRHLSAKTQGLPPGVLTVILDSCFSGGMFKMLIAGPEGFEVPRVKVWTPPPAQVRAEEDMLARMTRVEYKAFGLAPTTVPLAVAKQFGYPEPPAATKALLFGAGGAPPAAGPAGTPGAVRVGAPVATVAPPRIAARPGVVVAAPPAVAVAAPAAARGPAAARPEVVMAAPAAARSPAAARPEAVMAVATGALPGMAGATVQPATGAAIEMGAPMGGTKCLVPVTEKVTAFDTLAVEETGGAAVAGATREPITEPTKEPIPEPTKEPIPEPTPVGVPGGGEAPALRGLRGGAEAPKLAGEPGGGAEPMGLAPKAPLIVPPGELEVRGILLAASQANEPASAKTNQTEELSAFTFGLRRALREQGWEISPFEMMPNVTTRLHAMGFFQTPLLHSPVDLPFDLPRRTFILLQPRPGVAAALTGAVLSRPQPGAGPAATPPAAISAIGKAFAPAPQPRATPAGALTGEQGKALLDLIAANPEVARTVTAMLAAAAATAATAAAEPPKAAALPPTEAAPPPTEAAPPPTEAAPPPTEVALVVSPDAESMGEKLWLAAAMKAAGAPG